VDDVPSIKLDDRPSKRGCIGCLVVLLIVIGGITTFVYFVFHPRDRIQVGVKNLPVGTRWFCLASENDGMIEPMDWSPYYIFSGRMAPQHCIMSYPDEKLLVESARYVEIWKSLWRRHAANRQDLANHLVSSG
jgi:hypothetical protein